MTKIGPCGCVVEERSPGVWRSVTKCDFHLAERTKEPDIAYYERIGAIKDGVPDCEHYERELREAIGGIPFGSGLAVEIGCGVSPYVRMVREAGYDYIGMDESKTAVELMERFHGLESVNRQWHEPPSLFLAVHCLEHFDDAPGMLIALHRDLAPSGWFVLVIPDDEDLWNPDHLWFFSPDGLVATVRAAGFEVVKHEVRRIIEREKFQYLLARKS